jgi:hypothetical protein
MPLVAFTVTFGDQANPRVIPADAHAVPAELYARVDDDAGNPGGITRGDIAGDDIRALGEFEDGADVYVEAEADDVLDDADEETTLASRIWWRARILER